MNRVCRAADGIRRQSGITISGAEAPSLRRSVIAPVPVLWGCVQQLGRHDNKEVRVVMT
jgi:hypothetical protein